ncbi:MAG TPA: 4Fe-4S binding protein [Planctomycetota bacterium]|nr:4Fe-4S binding protein [Planctomycetota bacterium]
MAAVRILEEYCKSCGLCIEFCPRSALSLGANINRHGCRPAVFDESKQCSGCGNCTAICPDVAIELYARVKAEAAVKKASR